LNGRTNHKNKIASAQGQYSPFYNATVPRKYFSDVGLEPPHFEV